MEFFIKGIGAGKYGNWGTPLAKENLWQRPDERHYGRVLENVDELLAIPFKSIYPFQRHFIKNIKTELVFDNTATAGDYAPLDKEGEFGFWLKTTPGSSEPAPQKQVIRAYLLEASNWAESPYGSFIYLIPPGLPININMMVDIRPSLLGNPPNFHTPSIDPYPFVIPQNNEEGILIKADNLPTEDIIIDIFLEEVKEIVPPTAP